MMCVCGVCVCGWLGGCGCVCMYVCKSIPQHTAVLFMKLRSRDIPLALDLSFMKRQQCVEESIYTHTHILISINIAVAVLQNQNVFCKMQSVKIKNETFFHRIDLK